MTLRLSKLHWLWISAASIRRFPRLYYALCIGIGWGLFHGFPGYRRRVTHNMLPLCDGDLERARKAGLKACQMSRSTTSTSSPCLAGATWNTSNATT